MHANAGGVHNVRDFHCCAMQDKKDDVIAGVKSTALLFADHTKPWLSAFAASQIALLAVTGELMMFPFIASAVVEIDQVQCLGIGVQVCAVSQDTWQMQVFFTMPALLRLQYIWHGRYLVCSSIAEKIVWQSLFQTSGLVLSCSVA